MVDKWCNFWSRLLPLLSAMNADEIAFPRFVSSLRTTWSCKYGFSLNLFSYKSFRLCLLSERSTLFIVFSRKFDVKIAARTASVVKYFNRHTARIEIHSHPHASPEIPLPIHIFSPKTHIFHLTYCKKKPQTKQKHPQNPANHSNQSELKSNAK